MDHYGKLGKILEECRDDHDDDKAGKHQSQRGGYAAGHAPALVPHKGSGIHRNDARGTLADGKIVGQLLFRGPAPLLYQLPLEDGQHGISPAEGANPDFGKGQKQVGIDVHVTPAPPVPPHGLSLIHI